MGNEGLEKRKMFAYFQAILMLTSLFSFSFVSGESLDYFNNYGFGSEEDGLALVLFDKLKEPIIPFASAAEAISEPTVCCERTIEGASCVNTQESECAPGYASSPTSCETTSYCKLGTCYDSDEGICMGNTPENVCSDAEGAWDPREVEAVPQCQLGCCIIGDQAAYVPLVRCKKLSTFFGVPNDYRTNIDSEVACIAEAQSQDKGACVQEINFERVCEFTTRGECGATDNIDFVGEGDIVSGEGKKFYKDLLCSAEEIGTSCARAADTVCYQGDVYYEDSCGNIENVYSTNVDTSWNDGRVAEPEEVCDPNDGSNRNCGNCDYLLGTRCSPDEGLLGGDRYCKLTECVDREGNSRINGESWCVYDAAVGDSLDPVGSRHYREVCNDGEVIVEACADFRNEVCTSGIIDLDSGGEFESAICRVNRWQDCVQQIDSDECLDDAERDCNWVNGFTGLALGGSGSSGQTTSFSNPSTGGPDSFNNPTASGSGFTGNAIAPITGNAVAVENVRGGEQTDRPNGVCVPDIPPGLKFWEGNTAPTICAQGRGACTVVYEKGLLDGDWKVVEGKECLEEEWGLKANRVCSALGDCGAYINFNGDYTDDGAEWLEDGNQRELSRNSVNVVTSGFRGYSVLGLVARVVAFVAWTEVVPLVSGDIHPALECQPGTDSCNADGKLVDNFGRVINVASSGTEIVELVGGDTGKTGEISRAATPFLRLYDDWKGISSRPSSASSLSGSGVGIPSEEDANLRISPEKCTGDDCSKIPTFGETIGPLAAALGWAGGAFLAGQLIGSLAGLEGDNTLALSTALAGGALAYQGVSYFAEGALGGYAAPLAGIAVAAIIFVVMYKDNKQEVVSFECLPWQAPTGSDSATCEACNEGDLDCSEYRCRSLGANCELVNEGSEQELCVSVSVDDSLPPVIRPNYDELSVGLRYTDVRSSPPGPGFKITDPDSLEGDGCLKAFSTVEFGLVTDEPAQCRIDYESTDSFDAMRNYVGLSNLFNYNHSEVLVVPSAAALKNSSIVLQNGEEMNLFVRCRDQAGNTNEAEYAVRICIDEAPDTTAPEIRGTSILNGGCVAEDVGDANVDFYVNEPSQCRWSFFDQDYDSMTTDMSCNRFLNSNNLFTCSAEFTGIARDGTDYYIRCKDGAGMPEGDRNTNQESYEFSLIGSTGLRLGNLKPNSTIFGGVSPAPIELYAETSFGCYDGRAVCFYSDDGGDNYVQFLDTNTGDGIHTQRQDLTEGDYEYTIQCVDAGGNVATDTTNFNLDIDTDAPDIARIYEEGDKLKIVTVRDSECSYTTNSCDFSFDEGILMANVLFGTHITEWNPDNTYYIKCRDEFQNENAECSAIVKPSRTFY